MRCKGIAGTIFTVRKDQEIGSNRDLKNIIILHNSWDAFDGHCVQVMGRKFGFVNANRYEITANGAAIRCWYVDTLVPIEYRQRYVQLYITVYRPLFECIVAN